MHDLSVIGLGTIGLPVACLFAQELTVQGVESDASRLAWIRAGAKDSPEPGLSQLVARAVTAGLDLSCRPLPAQAYVLCVPTPQTEGKADLTALWQAVEQVDEVAPEDALVVLECTVPVGTTDKVAERLRRAGHEVHAPSLDGCGERAGSLRAGITVESQAEEVARMLFYEDLNDVVLVGTSAGGMTLCKVAELARERIGRVVFADALALQDGERLRDIVTRPAAQSDESKPARSPEIVRQVG